MFKFSGFYVHTLQRSIIEIDKGNNNLVFIIRFIHTILTYSLNKKHDRRIEKFLVFLKLKIICEKINKINYNTFSFKNFNIYSNHSKFFKWKGK